MFLEIITPDTKLFSGEVVSVSLPGKEGSFGVLDKHAPIVSSLKPGKIKIIDKDKKELFFDVKGGVVELSKNTLTVLAQ
ncbi:MAG: ATP synthase F1 subunit epsilon [Bacteroidetes bacterium]|nr:ATP synthase F1 subunit epsilon [Bacteroidota bacterium]